MVSVLTLNQIAEFVHGEVRGDGTVEIRSVAPLSSAEPGDLTWVADAQHAARLQNCRASAVMIVPDLEDGKLPAVVCARPDLGVATVLGYLQPPVPCPPAGVDPTAVIAASVTLGEEVAVGPRVVIQRGAVVGRNTKLYAGVFIGEDTVIGNDCAIWPNAVIRERCSIGNRVVIHPNVTIGADGFGYNLDEGRFLKIPHIGRVEIGDDVEIGANSCVDRAKYGATVVGRGTKIDNLVQIAHNVKIGQNCCIIAHVGIAGSAQLGDHVTLAGKVGIKDNIKIGNKVQVAACSCIGGDVPDGEVMVGTPARAHALFFKQYAALRRLPGMVEQFRELRKRVELLEAANDPKTG